MPDRGQPPVACTRAPALQGISQQSCPTDLAEWVARKRGRGDHGNPERTSHEEARVAETLKKGSRVTGAAREKLAADLKKKYDSGASIRALGGETGRPYGFV